MAAFEITPGTLLPGVAPEAMQGGRYVAEMILSDLARQARRPFSYRDKGHMATIGRSRAIAQTRRLTLTGRAAWLAWLFVHIMNLVGFRNRTAVATQWAWNYLFSRRESRLITEPAWKLECSPGPLRVSSPGAVGIRVNAETPQGRDPASPTDLRSSHRLRSLDPRRNVLLSPRGRTVLHDPP